MNMTKNQMIAEIKKMIKANCENKTYYFGAFTYVPLWLYEEKVNTKLNKMYIKKDVLYINTEDAKIGVDDEKVSEFDIDEVKLFYQLISNNQ